MDATSTRLYIEILEKTNEQLSFWFLPYELAIGFVTTAIAVLVIAFTFILWRQSRDYYKLLDELKNIARIEGASKFDEYIRNRDGEFKSAIGEAKEKIGIELESLRKIRDSINIPSAIEIDSTISHFFPPYITGVAAKPRHGLSEPQIQSILSLLTSFGADRATLKNIEFVLRGR